MDSIKSSKLLRRQQVLMTAVAGVILGGLLGYTIGSSDPKPLPAPVPRLPALDLPAQGKFQSQARDAQAQGLVEQALIAAHNYYKLKGSYAGFTNQELHRQEPHLANSSPSGNQKPGLQADPTQISITQDGVRLLPEEGKAYNILLCSISKATTIYCIQDDRKRKRTLYAREKAKTLAEAARGPYRTSW